MRLPMHKITESVIPVILLLCAIFLLLFFVQYRASLDADKATYIHITPQTAMPKSAENEMDGGVELDFSDDARIIKAQDLISKKMYREAEDIYFKVLSKEPSSQIHNWLGVLYLKQEDYHKAVVSFSNALKFNAKNYRALYNRALSYSALDETQKAIQDYKKLIEGFDSHAKSHFNLGLLYYKQKMYKDAIKEFEKTASLSSGEKNIKSLYLLGKSYSKMLPPDNEKAIAAFNATIRLKPNHVPSRLALIEIMYSDKPDVYKEQLEDLQRLTELEPENISIYKAIAEVHHKNKKEDLRLQALEKALQYEPNNVELTIDTVLLLMKAKNTQKAIARLEEVLALDPSNTKVYFLLGRLYYLQDDHNASLAAYSKVGELSTESSPELWNNLGLLYVKMKDIEKAKESYEKALRIRSDYPEVYYNLGLLFFKNKEFEKAKTCFEKAIVIRPDYTQAYYNLALISAQLNKHEEAIDAYTKVLELSPDKVEAKLNLAVQYSKLEAYENAQSLYAEILEEDESYFIAWLNLGLTSYQLKEYENSIDALRKAVALEPEHDKANRSLAKSYRAVKKFDEALEILERLLENDPSDLKTRLVYARTYYRYKKYDLALDEYKKVLRLEADNKTAQRMIKLIQQKKK